MQTGNLRAPSSGRQWSVLRASMRKRVLHADSRCGRCVRAAARAFFPTRLSHVCSRLRAALQKAATAVVAKDSAPKKEAVPIRVRSMAEHVCFRVCVILTRALPCSCTLAALCWATAAASATPTSRLRCCRLRACAFARTRRSTWASVSRKHSSLFCWRYCCLVCARI